MNRLPGLLTLLALASSLVACQQPSRPQPSAAASTACRAEVDRVYAAQNRADLSTRDQRDTPFAANYLPGVTSQGLGARYGRDNLLGSCLDNAGASSAPTRAGATDANPGTTFSPVAR
jgi:hypothetical protein